MDIAEEALSVGPQRARRAIGAMFFAVFGGAWLTLGVVRAAPRNVLALTLIVVGSAMIFSIALRSYREFQGALATEPDSPEKRRASRWFNIINAGQWLAILIVGNVLANMGLSAWVIPSAIFIVGLHLLPLAGILSNPSHYVTGSALMLLAAGYPRLSSAGPDDPVGCLGAGLILWGSALWAVTGGASPERADPGS
ncbi:MAG: hypothetical protein U0167_07735 [bacterium]